MTTENIAVSDTEPTHTLRRRIAVLTLAVLVGTAALTAATAGETPDDDGMIQLTDEVTVWSESTYAITQKHPDQATRMESPLVSEIPTRSVDGTFSDGTTVDGVTSGPAATAVSAGSLLQFNFWSERGADTEQFAGTNTSLVVAKLDDGSDPAVDGASELSPERAAGLLAADDRNDRAEFETTFTEDSEHPMRVVDDEGYFASYYDIENDSESGIYALYVVETVDGEGVTVDDGELSVDGGINVLGIDTVAVHDGESTVETSGDHAVGDTVAFDVTASGENVDHTVALFDESAVADEELTLSTDRELDDDITPEDVTVEGTAVHGVANVEDATVFGASVRESSAAQTSEVGMLTSYLSTAEPDADGPAGSITARSGLRSGDTISVETDRDWAAGEYTYVHVATAADGTTTTTSGTLTLSANESSTDSEMNESETNESNTNETADDASSDEAPGFGLVAALGALLAVLVGARQRAQT